MSKNTNMCVMACGEVFGFPAEFSITQEERDVILVGKLRTKGRNLSDFLNDQNAGVSKLANSVSILPKYSTDFSVDFVQKEKDCVFLLDASGMKTILMLSPSSKRFLLVLDRNLLNKDNIFENFVLEMAQWLKIQKLTLIVQTKNNLQPLNLLCRSFKDFENVTIPESIQQYELATFGILDLSFDQKEDIKEEEQDNSSLFGTAVHNLTGLNKMSFIVGGSISDKNFVALLKAEKIVQDSFEIHNLSFELQKTRLGIYCLASGLFKIRLNDKDLALNLYGAVSNRSFALSAAMDKNTKIPLNSHLSFSDLSMSIGLNGKNLLLGMTGRLSTERISAYGAFSISGLTPKVTLFTAALTSVTGRISLKDLIEDIADIHWDLIECLDIIVVRDLELQNASLGQAIKDLPNKNEKDYEVKLSYFESNFVVAFNNKMDEMFHVTPGNIQLIALEGNENQYLMMDKVKMRHYRIDGEGCIFPVCQVYACTEVTTIAGNTMPVGFFICGTLEIFNKKASVLFQVERGKSLVTMVQLDPINLLGLIEIEDSKQALPMEPIQGGFSGQLVKQGVGGPILYINIQRNKGDVTFYLNGKITLLKIFTFDALVLIKDRSVYLSVTQSILGFSMTVNLKTDYGNFSSGNFYLQIIFDTSGFLDIMRKAQEKLKESAKKIEMGVKNATAEISRAQDEVLELERQIDRFNDRIEQCRRERRRAKWYKFWIKAARTAEIVALELAKAGVYVAIGVAYAALEVAKAAVYCGGAMVTGVLNSLAYVIDSVANLLWIKSFELGIDASLSKKSIKARLVLVVFGKEITAENEFGTENLDFQKLIEKSKKFISDEADTRSKAELDKVEKGEKTVARDTVREVSLECSLDQIRINQQKYNDLLKLRNSAEEFFVASNLAYFDAYNEEDPYARENACRLSAVHWEEDVFKTQNERIYDDQFVDDLNNLVTYVMADENMNKAYVSDDMQQQMVELLQVVGVLNKKSKVYKDKTSELSVYDQMELQLQEKRISKKTRTRNAEVSDNEANSLYSAQIRNLINEKFGEFTDPVALQMKRELVLDLYEFMNPKFKKGSGNRKRNQ